MIKGFFYFIFLLTSFSMFGQNDSASMEKRKVKFVFAFDARRSFVLDKNTKFNGLKIGVRVGDDYQIGMGFYGMQQPLIQPITLDKRIYPESRDTVFFNFNYTTIFYDRIWFKNKRWELATPFHFGIGKLSLDYLTSDPLHQKKNLIRGAAFTSELSFTAQYKVYRWFAIGTGVGQRWFLVNDKKVKQSLNAPVYIIQFKILLGEIYRIITKKETSDEWEFV